VHGRAVQAAWEEIEISIPDKRTEVIKINREKMARFLGFMEGRARVHLPHWWAEALLDARANRRGNVYAGGSNLTYWNLKENETRPVAYAKLDVQDGKPVVRLGSSFAIISDELRQKLQPNGLTEGLSALLTPTRCYVAKFDSVGYQYELTCIERATAKTQWVSQVWGCCFGDATGQHHQDVQITEQGKNVVVFGVASIGFNAECFRAEDGVNVFRFSNKYSSR